MSAASTNKDETQRKAEAYVATVLSAKASADKYASVYFKTAVFILPFLLCLLGAIVYYAFKPEYDSVVAGRIFFFVAMALVVLIYGYPSKRRKMASAIMSRVAHKSEPMFNNVLAIVNPISGKRQGKEDWQPIEAVLRASGATVDTIVTEYGGQAKEFLRAEAVSKYDVVVIVGGDGFVYEVLNASGTYPKAIAVVPSGTGNGIATSLGLRSPVDAADALMSGDRPESSWADPRIRSTALDLIHVERSDASGKKSETVAALSVAWGAIADHDALTERELRRMPLKLLLVPMWIILRANTYVGRVSFTPHARQGPMPPGKAHTRDEASGRVCIDGEFNLVHVCNLPWIASDVHAAPGATADGGCFGILIMRGASRLELLSMFLAAESGAHTSHAAVELYWATEATIAPAAGPRGLGNIAIDGELVPPTKVDLRCVPSVVRTVQRV